MEVKSYSGIKEKPSFKKTDFRYKLWVKDRKSIKHKAKKSNFRVEIGKQPRGKGIPSVDTSKGRSNIDVLRLCLRDLHLREFPFGRKDGRPCDLYWHGVSYFDANDLPSGKVNKFPGMSEVLRKVNLGRMLDTFEKMFPEEYTFHPPSWFLPQQFAEFTDAVRKLKEKHDKAVFIIKPDEGSQGEGIYLIHEPREYLMNSDRRHIAQRYIADPMLIEDLKFDFRVYVLLASIDPLEIHICREGLARFCTVSYEYPTNKNLHQSFMHLTNYSLNKRSSTYQHTDSEDDGSKRTMSSVLKTLEQKGYDIERIWAQIEMLVVKTIVAIVPELKVELKAQRSPNKVGPSCFQILGFDILLTRDAQPILLEVNANPSLRIDYEKELFPGITEYVHSPVDEEIKRPLITDCLRVMLPNAPKIGHSRDHDEEAEEVSDDDCVTETPVRDTAEQQRESTLVRIYPDKYADDFEILRVLDRAANIFIYCTGIRGSLRMGSTGFRSFTRKCKLTSSGAGFSNAALDIMYIDLMRRWDHANNDRVGSNGLCFQAFVEAFFQISKKRFPSLSVLEGVEKLLDHSEASIAEDTKANALPRLPSKTSGRADDRRTTTAGVHKKHTGDSYYIDYKNLSPAVKAKPKLLTAKIQVGLHQVANRFLQIC